MAGRALRRPDSLIRSAQYNARFGWVRLPVVIIVAVLLEVVRDWETAVAWFVGMVIVERISTTYRQRLVAGDAKAALPHLLWLGLMSLLWLAMGVLLWNSGTEPGRIGAVIGLLTTALYGAVGGLKDIRVAAVIGLPSLLGLAVLVSLYGITQWGAVVGAITTLATIGACVSVAICGWAMAKSNAAMEEANDALARISADLAESNVTLEETSLISKTGGWKFDRTTGALEWTAETRRIFGVPADFKPDVRNVRQFFTPASLEVLDAAVERALAHNQHWDVEVQIATPVGEERWVRSNGKVVFADGRPVSLIGTTSDITERVRMEEELRKAQKLEAVGLLTGGIAHDFNNVLTAILSSAEVLKGSPDSRTVQMASSIAKAAERAGELTRNLMAYSRQQVLDPRPVDLNDVVRDMEELITPGLRCDLTFKVQLSDEAPTATLDAAQLTHALLNLAINAGDAMPLGGDIKIRTGRAQEGRVFVEVADSGPGIPDDVIEKIFDPFFTTKPVGVGTGLGLSMVHGFVTQSGGSVEVKTSPEAGTTFRLVFPGSAASGAQEVPALDPGDASGDDLPFEERTILVVDDEPLVRDAVAQLLGDKGYSVLVAGDGPSALATVRGRQLDLALIDVVLTDAMSGPELVTALRSEHPTVPALLMSGYAQGTPLPSEDTLVEFLQKPFSAQVLMDRVQARW